MTEQEKLQEYLRKMDELISKRDVIKALVRRAELEYGRSTDLIRFSRWVEKTILDVPARGKE